MEEARQLAKAQMAAFAALAESLISGGHVDRDALIAVLTSHADKMSKTEPAGAAMLRGYVAMLTAGAAPKGLSEPDQKPH